MSELEYYPSFTSYSDNHGNSETDLVRDVNGRSVDFDSPTLRPGDLLELRARAVDPRGRRMEVSLRHTQTDREDLQPVTVINSDEEAVFKREIVAADVGHGIRFTMVLTGIDTEYHRMHGKDQFLYVTYKIEPPADF